MKTTLKDFPVYFDWNTDTHPSLPPISALPRPTLEQLVRVSIDDEGLRDGLQGVASYPGALEMHRYIDLAVQTGITTLTVGIFAETGSRAEELTFSCLKYMAKKYPEVVPIVVVRPLPPDLIYAKACSALNSNTQILIFQGSSAPRLWVQGWSEESVLGGIATAIDQVNATCAGHSLSTLEDATRATPEFLEKFLQMSVAHHAERVVFADTTGHVDPWGAYRFVHFIRSTLDQLGGKSIEIDFHGHRDRYLDVPVALAAISAGATRIHGVVLGIGERSGNMTLDALLYNMIRMIEEYGGTHHYDLTLLPALCRQYAQMTHVSIPAHYPIIGDNAFATAVGIHADAQEKGLIKLQELLASEEKMSEEELSHVSATLRTIYSSVDHQKIGRIQRYVIGPLSGEATVRMWLYSQGYEVELKKSTALVTKIKHYAKQRNRSLSDEEIIEMLEKKGVRRMLQGQR